jgi:hypothetical protein
LSLTVIHGNLNYKFLMRKILLRDLLLESKYLTACQLVSMPGGVAERIFGSNPF